MVKIEKIYFFILTQIEICFCKFENRNFEKFFKENRTHIVHIVKDTRKWERY